MPQAATLPATDEQDEQQLDPAFKDRFDKALDAALDDAADEPKVDPNGKPKGKGGKAAAAKAAVPKAAPAPPPKQERAPRADAPAAPTEEQPLSDAEDPDPPQAEDQGEPVPDWTEDSDVLDAAEAFGLTEEEVQEFGSREEFVKAIVRIDKMISRGVATQQPQPQAPQQQQPQAPSPQQQEQRQAQVDALEELVKAEYLDDEAHKKGYGAIAERFKKLEDHNRQLTEYIVQRAHQELNDRFDELVDDLDIPALGKVDKNGRLKKDSIEKRGEVYDLTLRILDHHRQTSGRTPRLTRAMVERAAHIVFPDAQKQKLRDDLESQSRRRLGTAVSSRGNLPSPDNADAFDQETLRIITEKHRRYTNGS